MFRILVLKILMDVHLQREQLSAYNFQGAKALRVCSNVTTVAECNRYLVLDEVEGVLKDFYCL